MRTSESARSLRAWLDAGDGAFPPAGLDSKVVAAVYAIQPRRAPAPALTTVELVAGLPSRFGRGAAASAYDEDPWEELEDDLPTEEVLRAAAASLRGASDPLGARYRAGQPEPDVGSASRATSGGEARQDRPMREAVGRLLIAAGVGAAAAMGAAAVVFGTWWALAPYANGGVVGRAAPPVAAMQQVPAHTMQHGGYAVQGGTPTAGIPARGAYQPTGTVIHGAHGAPVGAASTPPAAARGSVVVNATSTAGSTSGVVAPTAATPAVTGATQLASAAVPTTTRVVAAAAASAAPSVAVAAPAPATTATKPAPVKRAPVSRAPRVTAPVPRAAPAAPAVAAPSPVVAVNPPVAEPFVGVAPLAVEDVLAPEPSDQGGSASVNVLDLSDVPEPASAVPADALAMVDDRSRRVRNKRADRGATPAAVATGPGDRPLACPAKQVSPSEGSYLVQRGVSPAVAYDTDLQLVFSEADGVPRISTPLDPPAMRWHGRVPDATIRRIERAARQADYQLWSGMGRFAVSRLVAEIPPRLPDVTGPWLARRVAEVARCSGDTITAETWLRRGLSHGGADDVDRAAMTALWGRMFPGQAVPRP